MSAQAPEAASKKSNKKLIVILLGVLLLSVGGGGGAAWFFLMRSKHEAGAQAHAAEVKPAKKPLFTQLEPFTVNLQDARGERFAQIGVTLQLDDPEIEIQIKDRLPAVRNQILLLISSKSIDELLTGEGKQQLASQIKVRAAQAIGVEVEAPVTVAAAHATPAAPAAPAAGKKSVENPVKDVLFSQFIVQ